MCAIVGILSPHNNNFQRAISSLAHRGPDGYGFFEDSRIALGHRRLAIIDLSSTGSQPMISRDGNYVLVFNGEIYNFKELRENLESVGIFSQGNSDSEVLLNLYILHGNSMLKMLNGIFAFAAIKFNASRAGILSGSTIPTSNTPSDIAIGTNL